MADDTGPQSIPLANSDYRRGVAQEADVLLRNRFVEGNPVLSANAPAFIARPALVYWQTVGEGPIRATYSAPGAFDDDLFVVSYNHLYRVDRVFGNADGVYPGLTGGDQNSAVRFAATGDIGTIGPRLWFADGGALYVYMDDGFAQGALTATAIADGDTIRVGSMYYRWSTGSLDSGSPAGTVGNPWRVLIDVSIIGSFTNMYKAINDTGVNGTDYSTAVTENPDAVATSATAVALRVRAKDDGIAGNAIPTTETGANMNWGGATMLGGGTPGVIQIPTPDDVGVLDVAVINNYVIVVPAQGEGINGRFYWIMPGETYIDPLNYATAERSPDPIYQCVVFGDQFWLPGQSTTEVFYMTGDPDVPVTRFQGVLYDRGTVPGTALQVKDRMVVIDPDGTVVVVQGGQQIISTPQIAERIRKAINYKNINS